MRQAYSKFGDVIGVSVLEVSDGTYLAPTARLSKSATQRTVPIVYHALVSFFSASAVTTSVDREVILDLGLKTTATPFCGEEEWKIHNQTVSNTTKGTVEVSDYVPPVIQILRNSHCTL